MEDAIFVCVRRILAGDKKPQAILDALIANHHDEWASKDVDEEYRKRRYVPQALRWAAFIRASLKNNETSIWAKYAIMNKVHPNASREWLEKEAFLKIVEPLPKEVISAVIQVSDESSENDLPISPDDSEALFQLALLTEGPYSAKAYYYGTRCAQSVPISIGA